MDDSEKHGDHCNCNACQQKQVEKNLEKIRFDIDRSKKERKIIESLKKEDITDETQSMEQTLFEIHATLERMESILEKIEDNTHVIGLNQQI